MRNLVILATAFFSMAAFGWGELGHRLVADVAARLLREYPLLSPRRPEIHAEALEDFLDVMEKRAFQQGHVANIPDIHWRYLEDPELQPIAAKLGGPPHYMNIDRLQAVIPLSYARAKEQYAIRQPRGDFFAEVGSNPWRAQQFANLYRSTLEKYTKDKDCDTTRTALTYAALMSHFTGDMTQPFHATLDHDGEATGQKGIHWYFENDLVNALQGDLDGKVFARAKELLTAPPDRKESVASFLAEKKKSYPTTTPQDEVVALVLTVLANSYTHLDELRALDLKYAVATAEQAWAMPQCRDLPRAKELHEEWMREKNPAARKRIMATKVLSPVPFAEKGPAACRLSPTVRVKGKTVAEWHRKLIVDRIALAAAITADVWAWIWIEAKQPALCWTWHYALKPAFVSPGDPECFGYAMGEGPPWKKGKGHEKDCIWFD